MIGRLNGKVAMVTVVIRSINRAAATLFSTEGIMVVSAIGSLHEGDIKPFEGSLTATVLEDPNYNLESSWRNIYG